MKKRKIVFGSLFILVTAFIFYNSLKPASESSEQSGFFVKIFLSVFCFFNEHTATFIIRKTAHFTEFFTQASFLSAYFSEDYKKYCKFVLAMGLITAAADELLQLFSDGRACMIRDVFIDFSGTAAAVLIFVIIRKRVKRV